MWRHQRKCGETLFTASELSLKLMTTTEIEPVRAELCRANARGFARLLQARCI
jgi:hypothetical protein